MPVSTIGWQSHQTIMTATGLPQRWIDGPGGVKLERVKTRPDIGARWVEFRYSTPSLSFNFYVEESDFAPNGVSPSRVEIGLREGLASLSRSGVVDVQKLANDAVEAVKIYVSLVSQGRRSYDQAMITIRT